MPKRVSRSATAIRAVATIRSVESCASASRSERWMVTGTTASAGDHSIITGCGARPPLARQLGEKFGVAGMAEAGAVEHALGDRIGDDGAGAPGPDMVDRMANGGEGGVGAGFVGLSGARGGYFAGCDHGQRVRQMPRSRLQVRRRRVRPSIPGFSHARRRTRDRRADRTAAGQARCAAATPQARCRGRCPRARRMSARGALPSHQRHSIMAAFRMSLR